MLDTPPKFIIQGYVPQPYRPDADETVKCPNCARMNDPDASYCDQCRNQLTASPSL